MLSYETERNISGELLEMRSREPEIFRSAQDDKKGAHPYTLQFFNDASK
jgi:hypothetical protein